MVKPTKRKAFKFFRSYFDVYNELSDKAKVQFMDALLDRQFLGKKPENLKGMAKFAYISQTNSIDSQVKGYEDKTKTTLEGGTQGGTQGGCLQEKEKEKEQEKLISIRKGKFKNLLTPFLDKYGSNFLNDFYLYWTEHNEKGKKMRFEYAKNQPFNIERRLATWLKNQKRFEKEKSSAKKEKKSAYDIIQAVKQGTYER